MEALPTDILKLILEQCRNKSCAWIVCKRWWKILGPQTCIKDYFLTSVELLRWSEMTINDCTMRSAAKNGHLAALQYMCRRHPCAFSSSLSNAAAMGGHLHILQWLSKIDYGWHEFICASAAYGGQLSLLQSLRLWGYRWAHTSGCAAEGGHLDVLQWAVDNGCPLDCDVCTRAAKGGHIKILEWLKSRGCVLNEYASEEAVKAGHLEVLKWLKANNIPFTYNLKHLAQCRGYKSIVEWIDAPS